MAVLIRYPLLIAFVLLEFSLKAYDACECPQSIQRIPEVYQEKFQFVLQHFFRKNVDQLDVERLEGGFSKSVLWTVFSPGSKKAYVVRLSLTENDHTGEAYEIAAKLRLGPAVRFRSLDSKIIITDFIHGKPLEQRNFEDINVMRAIFTNLRKLHESTLTFYEGISLIEDIDNKINYYHGNSISMPAFLQDAIDRFEMRRNSFSDFKKNVHGDFNINNIIIDDISPYFIDWNDSHLDHPYVDLAKFIWVTTSVFISPANIEEIVLTLYHDKPATPKQINTLRIFEQAIVLQFMLAHYRYANPAHTEDEIATLIHNASIPPLIHFLTQIYIEKTPLQLPLEYLLATLAAYEAFLKLDSIIE